MNKTPCDWAFKLSRMTKFRFAYAPQDIIKTTILQKSLTLRPGKDT